MGRQNFKQHARPDTVSDQEWWFALEVTAKYIAKKLAGHTNGGAFDESVFGMPATEFFSKRAFEKLYTGAWEWCSYRAVHTQLIRIALSDMHHHVEEWNKNAPPEMVKIDRVAGSKEDNTVKAFALDEIYAEHGRLEVEDLMRFNSAYNDGYLKVLMKLENYFRNGKIEMDKVVNEWMAYKSSKEILNTVPFNKYLFQYARRKGFDMKFTGTFKKTFDELLKMEQEMTHKIKV